MSISLFIIACIVGLVRCSNSIWNDASSVKCNWRLCNANEAKGAKCSNWQQYGNITSVTCINPVVGNNFTIAGKGSYLGTTPIQSPSYDLHIVDGIIVNSHVDGDGCLPNQYNFPLNAGTLYYLPVQCPVQPGPIDINLVAYIASNAPTGTVSTTLTLWTEANESGQCISCAVTELVIS
mmetsp:Transcript_38164/g.47310  ORF Transcript_38164/g.47310 Transcript_38164/m.47310 type:complete len:179 (+) Transcript_38164:41-577(+)